MRIKPMLNRLSAMIYKEFIYLMRDSKMRVLIIAVPLLQAVILGYAVNMDLKLLKTDVVNMDNSAESKDLISKFFAADTFRNVGDTTMAGAEDDVLAGKAAMILHIPAGFGKNITDGKPAPVQIIVDASNSVNALMASGYINNIIALYNSENLGKTPTGAGGMVDVKIRAWFNDNFESRNFFVPSMLAMLLMIVTVMLSGMAIVQEKESGTIEQLIVSPITAGEFIAGKCFPFALVSFIDVILIILISVFWFGIGLKGSLPLLLFASVLYIFCTLGLGLLISAISSTQQQASMSTFMIVFPLILLSGFAFPIENMPEAIQWVTYINPMRFYLDIIRGAFLKGLGIESLLTETIILTLLGILYLGAAVLYLSKKLK